VPTYDLRYIRCGPPRAPFLSRSLILFSLIVSPAAHLSSLSYSLNTINLAGGLIEVIRRMDRTGILGLNLIVQSLSYPLY
jgi:hypothetical protein